MKSKNELGGQLVPYKRHYEFGGNRIYFFSNGKSIILGQQTGSGVWFDGNNGMIMGMHNIDLLLEQGVFKRIASTKIDSLFVHPTMSPHPAYFSNVPKYSELP